MFSRQALLCMSLQDEGPRKDMRVHFCRTCQLFSSPCGNSWLEHLAVLVNENVVGFAFALSPSQVHVVHKTHQASQEGASSRQFSCRTFFELSFPQQSCKGCLRTISFPEERKKFFDSLPSLSPICTVVHVSIQETQTWNVSATLERPPFWLWRFADTASLARPAHPKSRASNWAGKNVQNFCGRHLWCWRVLLLKYDKGAVIVFHNATSENHATFVFLELFLHLRVLEVVWSLRRQPFGQTARKPAELRFEG